MYSNDSIDNNIRVRRQPTENIFEYEDNKNLDINEVKPNNVYDIELGEYIKQEIKNIPKTKNIGRIICGLIFFIFALYFIIEKFIELLSIYLDGYINNSENSYKNRTEYFLRAHNNFDNNNVNSILDHVNK
jgi:hypothetical protein